MDLSFGFSATTDSSSKGGSGSSIVDPLPTLPTASTYGNVVLPDKKEDSNNSTYCDNVVLSSYFYAPKCDDSAGFSSHRISTTETIDFSEGDEDGSFVSVCESDADEDEAAYSQQQQQQQQASMPFSTSNHRYATSGGNMLTLLLATGTTMTDKCVEANQEAKLASAATRNGNVPEAMAHHANAARLYRDAALDLKNDNVGLACSLLVISQAQAKSATRLQSVLNEHGHIPTEPNNNTTAESRSQSLPKDERLRATIRASFSEQTKEADMTDSTFLGRATTAAPSTTEEKQQPQKQQQEQQTTTASNNPVDDMMELERELRDMDMALEMSSSVASLRSTRLKNNLDGEGSFCVVPTGSFISFRGPAVTGRPQQPPIQPQQQQSLSIAPPALSTSSMAAGVRARANRVQTILDVPTIKASLILQQSSTTVTPPKQPNGLETSWWGHASQMSSSIISPVNNNNSSSTDTKQVMRLLDTVKTLGEENASLLRDVEDAQAARLEAKAAREQMKQFKTDYGKRFATLKAALEKFRKQYPTENDESTKAKGENPVLNSEFAKNASVNAELQKRYQTIRKLTVALKKERDESKKRDADLRKYERFYREVKAQSALKAKKREEEQQQMRDT